MRFFLSFVFVYASVFSYATAGYVPLCIDQVFDLNTGEFGPPDPSLCGSSNNSTSQSTSANGLGPNYTPAGITFNKDFQFKDQQDDSAGGSGDSVADESELGYPNSPFSTHSPMNETLSDWNAKNKQRIEQLTPQKKGPNLSDTIQTLNTKTSPKYMPFIQENLSQQFKKDFSSKAIFNTEVRAQMEDWAESLFPKISQWMKAKDSNVSELETYHINFVARSYMASLIRSFSVKLWTKQKMRELGKVFLPSGSSGPSLDWIQQVSQIINSTESHLKDPIYQKVRINNEDFYWKDSDCSKRIRRKYCAF